MAAITPAKAIVSRRRSARRQVRRDARSSSAIAAAMTARGGAEGWWSARADAPVGRIRLGAAPRARAQPAVRDALLAGLRQAHRGVGEHHERPDERDAAGRLARR